MPNLDYDRNVSEAREYLEFLRGVKGIEDFKQHWTFLRENQE